MHGSRPGAAMDHGVVWLTPWAMHQIVGLAQEVQLREGLAARCWSGTVCARLLRWTNNAVVASLDQGFFRLSGLFERVFGFRRHVIFVVFRQNLVGAEHPVRAEAPLGNNAFAFAE